MEQAFLKQAATGNNQWWRYLLTVLATIASVAIANVGVRQILPGFKALFPENQFGEDLGTSILIGIIFTVALLAFGIAAKKLHGRSLFSLINTSSRFSWGAYFKGFILWGGLLFTGGLIMDFDVFQSFLENLNLSHFLILFGVGFVTIGIQSFFEELVIRGYFLQGMHLRVKRIVILVLVNALVFGLLHFGYGIASFIHSFTFGIAFALIVIWQNRIEFASGAHNANNLLLSLVFLDIGEAATADFSWHIDWLEMGIHFVSTALFIGIVYKFIRN